MDRHTLNRYRLDVIELLTQHHIPSRDPVFIDALARLFYSLDQGDPHVPQPTTFERP